LVQIELDRPIDTAVFLPEELPTRQLRIAMIGQKGLPATYGGIEHHVENLSVGLTALGHRVTVYCRPYYSADLDNNPVTENIDYNKYQYKNVNLKIMPSLKTKHFDAITHSVLSVIDALKDNFDIIHIHGIGPALTSCISKLSRAKTIVTVHALDFRQKKWGHIAKLCLKTGLKSTLAFSDRTVCVSRPIRNYLGNPEHTIYIPNGVKEPFSWSRHEIDWLYSRGLKPGKYILFVGRLIEDKNCHLLSRAVHELGNGIRLAVAGDSSFTDSYVETLKQSAGPETVFLGNVYDEKLSALYANCALFVLPSSVEGLPLVLIEAMKHRVPVLASDIPENLEILEGNNGDRPIGSHFKDKDIQSLKSSLKFGLVNQELLQAQAKNAFSYVNREFNWQSIVKKTEQVYFKALDSD